MLWTDGLKKFAITCLNSVKSKRGAKLGRFLDQAIILHNNCQECSTFEPTNHPILRIWHYYGPSPPPTLVKCCLVWFRDDPAIIHWLLRLLLLLFFSGGGGRFSICKCSCFHELYLASWKYITERPFFLTVFFQDCGQFEDLVLQYIHILCLFLTWSNFDYWRNLYPTQFRCSDFLKSVSISPTYWISFHRKRYYMAFVRS